VLWCQGNNTDGHLGTGMGWTREFVTAAPIP